LTTLDQQLHELKASLAWSGHLRG